MNSELKRIWKEAVVAYFKVFSRSLLEGVREDAGTSVRLASLWDEI